MIFSIKHKHFLAVCKVLLIGLYLLCDMQSWLDRVEALSSNPQMLLVFFALYIASVAALVAAAFIPSALVRLPLALAFAAGSMVLHTYEWTTTTPFTYNSFETMLSSTGDAGDAAAQYAQSMIRAGATALLLLVALALPVRHVRLPFRLHLLVPTAVISGITLLIFLRGGEGTRGLPAALTPVAYTGIKAGLYLTSQEGERRPISFAHDAAPPAHDIVLIVDESISGHYLDINDPQGVYSALANDWPGLAVANFGIASAVTNCSAGSNRTLRFGGTRDNFIHVSAVYPSVWAYARNAGMRSVYIDGQRDDGELHNLKSAEERAEIDDFIQLGRDVPVVERDHRIADILSGHLNNDIAEFIYVNKVGAHFPVADKFPDSATRYWPTLQRGKMTDITDMGSVNSDLSGTLDEWQLYRNAYRNTLLWNVGGFFDRLLPTVDPAKAVIIYTADHGQDLHERGHPGKGTHCSSEPFPEEGAVPLVVIDDAEEPRLDLEGSLAANHDGLSHFRIFPTILKLMGYGEREFAEIYGPTMDQPGPEQLAFTTTYFNRLGRELTWIDIDPAELSSPPATDHDNRLAAGGPQ